MEIQRFSSVLPFLSRRTTKEVELGPYLIPEGTAVFVNVWSVHKDEKYFENPDQFMPERFINPETRTLNGKCDVLLPFGLGES